MHSYIYIHVVDASTRCIVYAVMQTNVRLLHAGAGWKRGDESGGEGRHKSGGAGRAGGRGGYRDVESAQGEWREGLQSEEAEADDIATRRIKLGVGVWASARQVAKMEKRWQAKDAIARREKRKADAKVLEAALLKYKQLGLARTGWRPRDAGIQIDREREKEQDRLATSRRRYPALPDLPHLL